MKNSKMNFYLLVVVIISIFGCTKEGPAGQNGNANMVISKFSHTWVGSEFPFSSNIQDNNVSAITQDIIDNGVIIGYVSLDGTTWYPLPYFKRLSAGDQINFRPTITVGHYRVEIVRNDGSDISRTQLGGGPTIHFKIVTMSK